MTITVPIYAKLTLTGYSILKKSPKRTAKRVSSNMTLGTSTKIH